MWDCKSGKISQLKKVEQFEERIKSELKDWINVSKISWYHISITLIAIPTAKIVVFSQLFHVWNSCQCGEISVVCVCVYSSRYSTCLFIKPDSPLPYSSQIALTVLSLMKMPWISNHFRGISASYKSKGLWIKILCYWPFKVWIFCFLFIFF